MLEWALRSVGVMLYWMKLTKLVIWFGRKTPTVLLYHACDHEENDFTRGLGINTPPGSLLKHLHFLQRYYNVVALAELESGYYPERAVIITFDDGYRSVYTEAFPRLARYRIPATVYLTTAVIDNTEMIWMNELNWLLGSFPALTRPVTTNVLGLPVTSKPNAILSWVRNNYDAELLNALLTRLRALTGTHPEETSQVAQLYLSWAEIRAMRSQNITFGNHTRDHPNLACVKDAAKRDQISSASLILEKEVGPVTSFAYPFGSYDPSTRLIALEFGFKSLMGVGSGNRPLDVTHIARVPVRVTSSAGLFAEIEVIAPITRWVRRAYRRARKSQSENCS